MQATRGRSQPRAALPASRAAEKESSAHLREQCRVAGQRRIRSGMLAIPTWYISGICTVLCLVESVQGSARTRYISGICTVLCLVESAEDGEREGPTLDLPEGGESRTVSSFTTAGSGYVAPTASWSSARSSSSSPCGAFLNSNDQRWSSSGTNTVGAAAVAVLGGGSSGIPVSL